MSSKKTKSVEGLEGIYFRVGNPGLRLTLKDGRYQLGLDEGFYSAELEDEFSCTINMTTSLLEGPQKPRRYRLTRRGKTYTLCDLSSETPTKFNRRDGKKFLAESPLGKSRKATTEKETIDGNRWKQIDHLSANVSFYLTRESVLRAATIPKPPSTKGRTVVRVTHSNSCDYVDSDIYVRLGNPKKPLGVQDFNTVSDWQLAKLVEDLVLDGKTDQWVLRNKKNGEDTTWNGTYEVAFQFPKGYTQIELKIISRVPAVCSIVLSNWKVFVR